MAKEKIAFTNFTAGELSPRLDGRTDLEKYFTGCKTLENMTIHPHGGSTRRPGTYFGLEAKQSSAKTRLIPFEFSTTQTYIMEFGNNYIRFFKDNGIITTADVNISAITKASPGVVTTSASHNLTAGDYVIIQNVVGMTELNGRQFKVGTVPSATTFQLKDMEGNNFSTSGLTTYASAGIVAEIYEVATTYSTADLFEIKYAQSADIMYFVHPSYPIKKLSRTGHTSWTLADVDIFSGPSDDISGVTKANPGVVTTDKNHGLITGDKIKITGVEGMTQLNDQIFTVGVIPNTSTITGVTKANPGVVTTSAAHGLVAGDQITITDVKGMTQLNGNIFTVGTVPSTTTFELQDSAGVNLDTSAFTTYASVGTINGPDTSFELQDASGTNLDTSAYGTYSAAGTITLLNGNILNNGTGSYPSSVSFFEQRLVFGGTNNDPQTLWFSKGASYENFAVGTDAADAMVYTIASNQVNVIRYLSAKHDLIIGTVGGEFIATSGSINEPITPTNIQIVKQTNYGAANLDALQVENVSLFLQRAKRKIREMVYSFDVESYVAPDMTLLAEHITAGGVTQMSYQQEPDSIIWAIRNDGQLLGLTYQRNENVIGWHRHIVGGQHNTGKTIAHYFDSFTANSSTVSTTNNTITVASHGHSTGDPIYYYGPTNVIGGLSNGLLYFAIRSDANTLKLATSAANATAGTAIELTTAPASNTTQFIYKGVNVFTNIIYAANHGLATGDHFYYKATGTAIGGLVSGTKYFIKRIDDNQFKVSSDSLIKTFVSLTSSNTSATTDLILQDAKVESIAVIPSDDGEYQLWMICNRFINGVTRRFVEYLTPFNYGITQDDAFYVDAGLTYDSIPTSTLTGLHHLEGETVTILADGATHPTKVVTNGNITLDRNASKVHVGLGYTSILQTLRVEGGAQQGVAQSRIKRINEVTLRLYKTLGIEVGGSLNDMETIPFRSSAALMGVPVNLFTGDKTIEFRDDYNTDGHVVIRQQQPLPVTILAIYPEVTTYEG